MFTLDVWSPLPNTPVLLRLENTNSSVLDQSNETITGGAGSTSQWQSFTCNKFGLLDKIEWRMSCPIINSSRVDITMKLYKGEGTNGDLVLTSSGLKSPPYLDASGNYYGSEWITFNISTDKNIFVQPSEVYTVELTTASNNVGWIPLSTNNPYTRGRASSNSDWDYLFRTYVKELSGDEILANTTTTNAWETIIFDFQSSTQLTYEFVKLFMNYNVVNQANQTYYWDNLQQGHIMIITSTEVNNGAISNDSAISLTFTSSKPTNNFNETSISVTNGSISNFVEVNSSIYTATFTPIDQGLCIIDVAAGVFTDNNENGNLSSQFIWTYDSVGPLMTITAAEVNNGSTYNNSPISLTFISNEPTNDFDEIDISVVNGTISNFNEVSSTVYTATFTPTNQGLCRIDVPADVYSDNNGNLNLSSQFIWTYDSVGPIMTITAAEVNNGATSNDSSLSLTFTISEPVNNFDETDITVTNGSISNFSGSGTNYTATFTPVNDGLCTIDVYANTFTDYRGNSVSVGTSQNWFSYINAFNTSNNSFAFGFSYTISDLRATISATSVILEPNVLIWTAESGNSKWFDQGASSQTANKYIEANSYIEDNTLAGSDLTFAGNVSNNSLSSDYTSIAFIKALDPNNNFTTVVNNTVDISNTGNFTISASALELLQGYVIQYGFAVTGPLADPADTNLGNITIVENPTLTLGNNNLASNQFEWTYDGTEPIITITANEVNSGAISNDLSLSLTFTISEPTTTFDVTDITVTNGTISDFTQISYTVYTAIFMPNIGGICTIDVNSNTFTDLNGNNNLAATQFTWTYQLNLLTLELINTDTNPTYDYKFYLTAPDNLDFNMFTSYDSFDSTPGQPGNPLPNNVQIRIDVCLNDESNILDSVSFDKTSDLEMFFFSEGNVLTLQNLLNGVISFNDVTVFNLFNLQIDSMFGGLFNGSNIFILTNSDSTIDIIFHEETDQILILREGWNLVSTSFKCSIQDFNSIIIPNSIFKLGEKKCKDPYVTASELEENVGYYIETSMAGPIKLVRI